MNERFLEKGLVGRVVDSSGGRKVNSHQPSTGRKAKTLRNVREATAKGDKYYDQDSERQIVSREAVR